MLDALLMPHVKQPLSFKWLYQPWQCLNERLVCLYHEAVKVLIRWDILVSCATFSFLDWRIQVSHREHNCSGAKGLGIAKRQTPAIVSRSRLRQQAFLLESDARTVENERDYRSGVILSWWCQWALGSGYESLSWLYISLVLWLVSGILGFPNDSPYSHCTCCLTYCGLS